jgi:hypothetical protein
VVNAPINKAPKAMTDEAEERRLLEEEVFMGEG